ncbi:ABC transporter permease [Aestuariibacter salexigens]|uniref:ABC transporter permease n=1 Tax=Aestuariibacter salexigens TaxID=226010 RepID=UPI000416C938|nr:ABC transporter permease [Aestuariibacter salexigens]
MFQNYIKIALRALIANKLYALINVLGLAIGLTIFLFGGMLANYEKDHDTVWQDNDLIYYVGSTMSPNATIGIKQMDTTYSALGPLIKEGVPEVEYMARTIRREYLVSTDDNNFNEPVRFADADLLRIFSFDYIEGDATALDDPEGAVLTREQAIKMFGRTDVRGEVLELNHEHQFRVQAVIENLPLDSHFRSNMILGEDFGIYMPLKALEQVAGWEANYYNTSGGNYVYLKLRAPMPLAELNNKLNTVHLANTPQEQIDNFMAGLYAKNIKQANAGIWDMIGMPVIESIQILGLLVLIIAIVNYTNLATAQSLGRTREVGIRKALGASRGQLMSQFLTESLTITAISMIIALALIEVIVPMFNDAMGKVMTVDYISLLPTLLLSTILVGLVSGAYPSYLITKTNTIYALKGTSVKGSKGSFIRSMMIGVQFMLSIFMLGMVLIMYFQNDKVKDSSLIFPKDEVLVLREMNKQAIVDRQEILRNELLNHPHISAVSFATQVPFEQSNSSTSISRNEGEEQAKFQTNRMFTDDGFIPTFDIQVLAGENFSRDNSSHYQSDLEARSASVLINELLREQLGFASNEEAIGQSYYAMPNEEGLETFRYDIIGVIETQNILGLHNQVRPFMLQWREFDHYFGSIRIAQGAPASVVSDIETIWQRVNPDYPIEHQFLSDIFDGIYNVFRTMNGVLAGFAGVALTLALIGLFGLAAYMARTRTKEIGIRKVLGANEAQLVKMMLWQFSKPVMWAILIAIPLAYLASGAYLNFFADRIEFSLQVPLIIIGGVTAVALSWSVIALHALKVARSNPVRALHYE